MTHLVVFVDSPNPGPYVNTVVHNLVATAVDKVTFAHVFGFPGDEESRPTRGNASRTMTDVVRTIASLAGQAEYNAGGATTKLDETNGSCSAEYIKAFYGRAEAVGASFNSQDVHYRDLRTFLKKVREEKGGYLLDVTGCRKRFFGDFVALGLVDGMTNICTFDVLSPPDFAKPWAMLIHELARRSPPGFRYVDIMDTKVMNDCSRAVLIRAPRLRHAGALAIGFAVIGVALNMRYGLESAQAKWTNVVAQFATFAALFFVFFPPRNS